MVWSSSLIGTSLLVGWVTGPIVVRHDVPAEEYLAVEAPAALVDMPYQGHGVLIEPEWVVTAAHLIFSDYRGKTVRLGGADREIEFVVIHPGYSKPRDGLFSGYSGPSQAYLRANHDIALVKLAEPVTDVTPMPLYASDDEVGAVITLYGRGNTGNGLTGQVPETSGVLRRARNRITAASDQWLTYKFDRGEAALPLEGIQGDGDSGGPAIIRRGNVDLLAGLVSWDVYDGNIADFLGGLYGMEASLVRLSYYGRWIQEITSREVDGGLTTNCG